MPSVRPRLPAHSRRWQSAISKSDLPKFANRVCRYSEIFVSLNSHLIWQTGKSDVERGSAFGLISHGGLPYCAIRLALFYASQQ
jgi:hypothetical protein